MIVIKSYSPALRKYVTMDTLSNEHIQIGVISRNTYISLKAMEKIFNIAGGTRCGYAISYDPDLVICTWGMLPSEIEEMKGVEFGNA